ncbi:hypothetical protein, partial [Mesorhizobium sp. M7A.F.Ca.AU.001.01.1.1]|uniref:hypothetical protein n=1 Tax=Mesorhizobium sp. M7A.F.Ca.AU.001.01.1.1 TaxID=2496675 RepID=UPI0019D4EE9F
GSHLARRRKTGNRSADDRPRSDPSATMTPTLQSCSIITRIEHHLACVGQSRGNNLAPTALRKDQPFQHNQEKPQEGNER